MRSGRTALQVLMPMAGLGTRFATLGSRLPKPLLPVCGKPMFLRALDSLAALQAQLEVIAVVRESACRDLDIASRLVAARPGTRVVAIKAPTRGAAETCLSAEAVLDADRAVLVLDCDLWFRAPDFLRVVDDAAAGRLETDAVLLCFPSQDSRYSFAELDGDKVLRTAEKRVISRHAICGAYLFRSARTFLSAVRALMETPPDPEYYISLVHNEVITAGGCVTAQTVETVLSFGTPEEMERSMPLLHNLRAA